MRSGLNFWLPTKRLSRQLDFGHKKKPTPDAPKDDEGGQKIWSNRSYLRRRRRAIRTKRVCEKDRVEM